ncbi:MAG: hypothetical protein P0Y65_19925 [Candidatus Devosia phytovorans]|uniref:Uncharacterized protein n=1 Tax=Candidatus Devosia phytovorans TaxID=3121372 RepID=A0AAJ5VVY3_9HYPH|nr:hypothetical protein [Devosia sp.]WEK04413.1 MAG: hypothetical protein P0Y65_19925 [Devosia sp.]
MTSPIREILHVAPAEVIRRLPAMGNLMITAKQNGATHERIGTIETVTEDAGWLVCGGDCHDSRIDPSVISRVLVDRSSVMQGKTYPRIDFHAGEVVLFSVVGFADIEPFDAALASLGAGEALPEKDKEPRPQRDEATPEDVGAQPLRQALDNAGQVTIRFIRPGFEQQWSGVVESVKPAMGFINVMREDFHLHLLGGSVAAWRDGAALDAQGKETGLYLVSAQA